MEMHKWRMYHCVISKRHNRQPSEQAITTLHPQNYDLCILQLSVSTSNSPLAATFASRAKLTPRLG